MSYDKCKKCNELYTDIDLNWCKQCQIKDLKKKFTKWTSGNEKIDNFIQERQLEIDSPQSKILEWIPYEQFSDINEVNNDDLSTVYSTLWKNGPLYWDSEDVEYSRRDSLKITLKYLHNLQNIEEFLNEVKVNSINMVVYGISQNSNSEEYIMVLQDYCIKCNKGYTDVWNKWCKQCQTNNLKKNFINWTSGNEKIDNFIQEKQLEIDSPQSTILKWIPYEQFSDINEVNNDDLSTVYSAKWKSGPIYWDKYIKKDINYQNNEITLKYLHNLQNIEEFLNEV
uniref:Uncharacterized protein n=1 Tax=Rhizophagus irregularis (strain DAOM 181602 / DAOM 197198 / MUCL 43194) TaxID=747089 RepID=U9TYJ2_RHIID